MDPLCHTLTGAVLAEAGLKHRTRLASAALLIGANLPDVDVAATAVSAVEALAFRRGWTHGVLAMAVLPVVLAAALMAWDRLVGRIRAGPSGAPARFKPLVSVSALALASHYLLDFLNVYGIRLLMPFSGVWFYGDALFIVDPWMWLVIGGGVVTSRRRIARNRPRPDRPARRALQAVGAYVAIMLAANVAARQFVRAALPRDVTLHRMMIAPVVANPFQRDVVLDWGGEYEVARFDWLPAPRLTRAGRTVATGEARREAADATATRDGRSFLTWARFPFFRVTRSERNVVVRIADLRYAIDSPRSFAEVTIDLGVPP